MSKYSGAISTGGGLAKYGDGSDGDVTISGLTSLTSDMYYDNLTVNDALSTEGFRIFVKGTLTIGALGFIQNNASDAFGPTGGPGGGGFGSTDIDSGTGANGVTTTTPGLAGTSVGDEFGGDGGAGGAVIGQGGGAGATAVAGTAVRGWPPRGEINAITSMAVGSAALHQVNGGAGGGSGGAFVGSGSATSGGGGGGGLNVVIACRVLNNNGTIRANGGAGGNGAQTSSGAAGGGGGGGGGYVYVVAQTIPKQGTIIANGGAGGLGAGGGSNPGVAGAAGTVVILTDG